MPADTSSRKKVSEGLLVRLGAKQRKVRISGHDQEDGYAIHQTRLAEVDSDY